jgi:cytochrome c oxidase subunit 3
MTLCLLASSLTMALAVRRAADGEIRGAVGAIGATFALGFVFLLLHLGEWRHLTAEGVTLRGNPWGVPLFGGTFYTLTGLHMLHVLAGLAALATIGSRLQRGRTSAEGVVVCALYWHFVELVWMFLFPLVYLTSVKSGGAG